MPSITFDFTDRVALVTGAAQGIGQAIARSFLDAGATVLVLDANGDGLAEAWPEQPRVHAHRCDVSSPEDVRSVFDAATAGGRAIDVVVNNAGVTRDSVSWKLSDADWRFVLDVHLTGTFNICRAAIPPMRAAGRGRIVNVTSFTGMHGNIGQANYAAAKAGIIGLTKTVAKEVARFGITVNAVSPNAETPMVAAVPPAKRAELESLIPMGRFGATQEMASAVSFLASDEAAYVTGVVLPVDGGMSM